MTTDLSTVSRDQQRKETMLQHPIFLYQVHVLGRRGEQCVDLDSGEEDETQKELFDAIDNISGEPENLSPGT